MEPLGFNWEMWNAFGIWGLVFSPLGFMLFLFWLDWDSGSSEIKPKEEQELETEQSTPPKRLLIPLSLSAEEAFAVVKTHLLDDHTNPKKTRKIPKGLFKCKKCGEYKGAVTEEGEDVMVSCLCDGILCPKCKKNKIHRPISNSYDPETNDIVHYPYFSGMMGCGECRKSQ